MSRSIRILAAATTALLPLAAQAHPGHDLHAGFMEGVMHPLTGWDHLVVLLSLGMLAGGRSLRVIALCAALLVAALAGGAALGLNWPAVPFVEPGIIATVVACLVLLLVRRRIGAGALLALSMAFAFIHGIAHGQEAPVGDLAGYFTGFTVCGLALYGVGLLLASAAMRHAARSQKGAPITSRQPGKSPASR